MTACRENGQDRDCHLWSLTWEGERERGERGSCVEQADLNNAAIFRRPVNNWSLTHSSSLNQYQTYLMDKWWRDETR